MCPVLQVRRLRLKLIMPAASVPCHSQTQGTCFPSRSCQRGARKRRGGLGGGGACKIIVGLGHDRRTEISPADEYGGCQAQKRCERGRKLVVEVIIVLILRGGSRQARGPWVGRPRMVVA